MWLKRQPPPHLPLPSQDKRISAQVLSAGNHSLRILQHCTDKRAAGNLLLLSLLNNPANSINLKFSRNKKPWSNGVVQRISQKAGALNCSACCALADSGHVTASSLPVTPIHALRVSWPTNLFWDCPRQSSLKARSCIAMQNSSSSTPCPSQQSPVRGCSVNCTFMAGVWSLIQPWIPVFRNSADANLRRCWWQLPHGMRKLGETAKKRPCGEERAAQWL